MATNIQNLTAEEKAIQSKYIQIGNGLLPDAIKTVEEVYPSVTDAWDHKYLIVNEMLMAIGYDKIGAYLSKNEVMMYIRQACAYETKNNNDKNGVVKGLPYAFAHILMVRKANAELLTELYKDKMVSEAQIERIKAARDRIAVKFKVSEKGAEENKIRNLNDNNTTKREPKQRQIDPEIAAAINAASKPDVTYNFSALISSLQEEGLHVEMQDGCAHIFVDVDENRVDAGIIRPGNIVTDLDELKNKCLSLGKGIDLSIIINKANKEEENMGVHKSFIDAMIEMLVKHGATVERPESDKLFVFTEKGELDIDSKDALLMGRYLYKNVDVLFNQFVGNYFKSELAKLFKPEGNDSVVTGEEDDTRIYNGNDAGHIDDQFMDQIDNAMENQDHVLDSTWSQRKFGDAKINTLQKPVNMYQTTLFDLLTESDTECAVRFTKIGKKFIGTLFFKKEGWKSLSDVRGDFKDPIKTTWEWEPENHNAPIFRIRYNSGRYSAFGLGINEKIDTSLRRVYKLLVKWYNEEIAYKAAKDAQKHNYTSRRYVDGGKK